MGFVGGADAGERALEVADLGGAADETHGEQVEAVGDAPLDALPVAIAEGGGGDLAVGEVDALAAGDRAADEDAGAEDVGRVALSVGAVFAGDGEAADGAVVDEDALAGLDFAGEERVVAGERIGLAGAGPAGLVGGRADEDHVASGLKDDGLGVEFADADLGALEVSQDADGLRERLGNVADDPEAAGVVFERAVGEVQAEDAHAGLYELADEFGRVARGADGRDDLGERRARRCGSGGGRGRVGAASVHGRRPRRSRSTTRR